MLTGKTMVRHFILMTIMLAMALVAGCGGGGGGGGDEGIASMAQGRWGHTATLLEGGRILVVGGQETETQALATAEVYDPSTATWSSAGSMSGARGSGHTATLLGDGRVLVVGGSSSAEVYDPSTGIWSSTGSMSGARVQHTATLLGDGRVLVAGGIDTTGAGQQKFDSAEVYDPSTGQWSSTGKMAEAYGGHSAALLRDGRVLVVGIHTAEAYDPSTDTWSPAGALSRARVIGYLATVLGDGRVLITGGEFQGGGFTGISRYPVKNADMYDPSTGTWSAASPMQEPRASHAATLLQDGRVLVISGNSGADQAEIYDPATDTWSSAGKPKQSRGNGHTATLLGDGTVLVVGGKKSTKEGDLGITAVEIYDPTIGW